MCVVLIIIVLFFSDHYFALCFISDIAVSENESEKKEEIKNKHAVGILVEKNNVQ